MIPKQDLELLHLLSKQTKAAPFKWSFAQKVFKTQACFFELLELPPNQNFIRLKSLLHLFKTYLNEAQLYSLNEAIRTAYFEGEVFTLRFLLPLPSKGQVWLRISGYPIRKEGKTVAIEGIIQNITAQKNIEEELQLTEYAIEKANILIFRLSPNGRIEAANKRAINVLKTSKSQILNKFFYEIEIQFNPTGWKKYATKIKQKIQTQLSSFLINGEGAALPMNLEFVYFGYLRREAIYVFAKDMSQFKNQEKELFKAQSELTHLQAQMAVSEVEEFFLEPIPGLENIVSQNRSYKKMLQQLEQVAPTDTTVLILGETGTGKELLADALQALSLRKDQPFIKVNCATLPEHLVESELFGHEKGAFTSAINRRIGRFELAHQGTIFLDEIAELPLDLQAKLLRVLQEGSFERIGGTETIEVNVRIIAATNKSLAALVAEGKFRRDLYYRLNVFPIDNIPLRQRKDDILFLVQHFLKKYNKRLNKQVNSVNKDTLRKLRNYDYPGNIRELENLIERGVVLAKNNVLKLDTISAEIDKRTASFKSFDEMQRDYIIEALKMTNWRISGEHGAARLLGLNSKTLESKMRKLGIQRPK